MGLVIGVDEAGRGPVIGPLVMAGVVIEDKEVDRLKNIGVKDSKLLSQLQRERLFDQIIEIVKGYVILVVKPMEIDEAVEGKDGLNLNWLEAVKSAQIVNELNDGVDKVILDCPSNNEGAYENFVKDKVKSKKIKYIVEHKADENYFEVGAASILAKVTRDREIEKIKKKVGVNFGSGYPSDPLTQKFLEKYWDKYDKFKIFRKSWKSWKNLRDAKEQKRLGDY